MRHDEKEGTFILPRRDWRRFRLAADKQGLSASALLRRLVSEETARILPSASPHLRVRVVDSPGDPAPEAGR
jgi:hypothetical protein